MRNIRQAVPAWRVREWGGELITGLNPVTYWGVSTALPMALTVTFEDSPGREPVLWRVFRPDLSAALATHEAWQGDGGALWVANPVHVGLSLVVPGREPVYYVFSRPHVDAFVKSAEAFIPEDLSVSEDRIDAFLAEVLGDGPS